MAISTTTKEFLKFTNESKSVYHVVQNIEKELLKAKYQELVLTEKFDVKLGGKYYVKRNDSSIFAISIPKKLDKPYFKITGNHTDAPCFKIKSTPEMNSDGGFMRLNTEVYGGPILSTWFDRPLSVAGRVLVKTKNILEPKTILVDIDRALLVIPNLAIHQNRDVNEGVKITKQNDTLPVLTLINDKISKDDLLLNLILKENKIKKSDVLDMELFIYDRAENITYGLNDEFILASKIDNLASAFAGLKGILEAKENHSGINVLACFDNEETGSMTKQGADSNLLVNILERIIIGLYSNSKENLTEKFYQAMYNSFLISTDGAHAVHPAKSSKSDPTSRPTLNKGFVIKNSAGVSYTTDGFSKAIIKNIAAENKLSYQEFFNHSDERGGSTIGPVSAKHLDINSVDLGIPMLAMHSIKETAGVDDILNFKSLLKSFYSL